LCKEKNLIEDFLGKKDIYYGKRNLENKNGYREQRNALIKFLLPK